MAAENFRNSVQAEEIFRADSEREKKKAVSYNQLSGELAIARARVEAKPSIAELSRRRICVRFIA